MRTKISVTHITAVVKSGSSQLRIPETRKESIWATPQTKQIIDSFKGTEIVGFSRQWIFWTGAEETLAHWGSEYDLLRAFSSLIHRGPVYLYLVPTNQELLTRQVVLHWAFDVVLLPLKKYYEVFDFEEKPNTHWGALSQCTEVAQLLENWEGDYGQSTNHCSSAPWKRCEAIFRHQHRIPCRKGKPKAVLRGTVPKRRSRQVTDLFGLILDDLAVNDRLLEDSSLEQEVKAAFKQFV